MHSSLRHAREKDRHDHKVRKLRANAYSGFQGLSSTHLPCNPSGLFTKLLIGETGHGRWAEGFVPVPEINWLYFHGALEHNASNALELRVDLLSHKVFLNSNQVCNHTFGASPGFAA
eukprot:684841-Pelagomonas_calceolata.AAC.1